MSAGAVLAQRADRRARVDLCKKLWYELGDPNLPTPWTYPDAEEIADPLVDYCTNYLNARSVALYYRALKKPLSGLALLHMGVNHHSEIEIALQDAREIYGAMKTKVPAVVYPIQKEVFVYTDVEPRYDTYPLMKISYLGPIIGRRWLAPLQTHLIQYGSL